MMPVVLSPLGEGLGIGRLRLRPEQLRLLPVPGDALALQVVEVGGERRRASAMPDDARLDDRVAGSAGQEPVGLQGRALRSEEHTSELQSLMRISYAVFCLQKKKIQQKINH